MGTTASITATIQHVSGGDFPAGYTVRLQGPYLRGCSTKDIGYGELTRDIVVPDGATPPFEVGATFADLGPADCYVIEVVSGQTPNCTPESTWVEDENLGGRDKEVFFVVTCDHNRIAVSVVSIGDRDDIPDSYGVTVDGEEPRTLSVPASAPYTVVDTVRYLAPGMRTVTLTEPPVNCAVSPGLSITEPLDPDETLDIEFTVDCAPTVVSAMITGVVRDTLTGPGLGDVYVQAIHETSGGLPPVQTNGAGEYQISVSETGVYSLCAIGAIPAASLPQRFVNTNCSGETVTVTAASVTETLDLSIETGYHLAVTGGPFDFDVAPDAAVPVQFGYRAWNRASVPATTTWIVVGLEVQPDLLEAQDAELGGDAGPFGSPKLPAAGPGPLTADLTAPSTQGTYDIYARLLAVVTDTEAMTQFESGFPAAKERNYIKLGTVTVTAPASPVPFSGPPASGPRAP